MSSRIPFVFVRKPTKFGTLQMFSEYYMQRLWFYFSPFTRHVSITLHVVLYTSGPTLNASTHMRTKRFAKQMRVCVDGIVNMRCVICEPTFVAFCANTKGLGCPMCPVLAEN